MGRMGPRPKWANGPKWDPGPNGPMGPNVEFGLPCRQDIVGDAKIASWPGWVKIYHTPPLKGMGVRGNPMENRSKPCLVVMICGVLRIACTSYMSGDSKSQRIPLACRLLR